MNKPNSTTKLVVFSKDNPIMLVGELRAYGEHRVNEGNPKGFENLSQLTDAQILNVVGDANTRRKAKYRLSGFVGQSISFSMQKDWAELTSNPKWKVKETEESKVMRRYQVTKIK